MKLSSNLTRDLLIISVSGSLLLAACGGSSTPASTPADEEAAAEPTADPVDAPEATADDSTPKSFDEMTPPERLSLMKKVVVPEMGAAFKEFDGEEFAEVSCPTCHGPGAKSGDFEMPTKSLPALDQAEMEEHPEMTKFMKEIVVPKMASILGEEPYNPETHEGFGCFDCHTKKE